MTRTMDWATSMQMTMDMITIMKPTKTIMTMTENRVRIRIMSLGNPLLEEDISLSPLSKKQEHDIIEYLCLRLRFHDIMF